MKNKLAALAFIMSELCSCQGINGKLADDSSATISGLGVNDSLVMRYVTCSKGMIDTFIAQGDSVFSKTDKYSIEDLGLNDGEYNKWLVASYGDTIPAVVSIYDAYDLITGYSEDDETNASFVWHELAKRQIIRFLQKDGHEVTEEDINKVFHVIDRILEIYACGTQYDMNMAASCWILVADYHLLEAYKQLMDCFPTAEIRKLVHEDYKFLFDTCRKYMKYRYERDSYSDLPREMRCMLYDILTAKVTSINRLMKNKASEQSVIKNLREHTCFENGNSFKLTYNLLMNYYTDDY